MVTYLWGRDLSLPVLIDACTEAGLDGVELRTTHGHAVERGLDAAARRTVRDRFAASPVEIVGIGSDERFDSPDPDAVCASAIGAIIALAMLQHARSRFRFGSWFDSFPHPSTAQEF